MRHPSARLARVAIISFTVAAAAMLLASCGGSSNAATAPTPDSQPPTAPSGLTATAKSPSEIDLSWTASADNIGVTGYRVERCSGFGCSSFAQIATTTGTTYIDSGLSASTSYSYRTLAADAAGNTSVYSAIASAQTSTQATVPAAPSGVSALPGNGQAVITWTAPNSGGSPITGYTVTSNPGAITAAVVGTATTGTVTGLANGTSYTFTVVATNAQGNGPPSAASNAITPSAPAATVFPVAYAADHRTLRDQNGTPFPILGRTAWFVISNTPADYQLFIDDSVSRGYTAIEMHVLDHDSRGNHPPANGAGDLPFLKRLDGGTWGGALSYSNISNEAPDFSTPNPSYWAFVDTFLAYCESKGILVFFFPAYAGYQGGNQGWMQELVANGPTRINGYGAFLAARYKNQKNLVWMLGGDLGTFTQPQSDVEGALLAGLNSVAGQQSTQFSAEWDSESIGTDQSSFGSAMTLNGVYSFRGDVSTLGRRAYATTPVIPAFLLEEPYDEEGPDGLNYNPNATQPVRRFQWAGWLNTVGGYMSGNGYIWAFSDPNWRTHLDTQGARDMARLNGFIRSFAWWQLVPSGLGGMKQLVTSGVGAPGAADYVSAAATPTGTLLIAYVPPAHSGAITVDLTAMSGITAARWYNPTTAASTPLGSFPNAGLQVFTPPGDNGTGFTDWVLVLEKQ